MSIKLSILVPSVAERRNTFLPKSLDMLYGQYEQLSADQQAQVEILYLIDNKKQMLGYKRNSLIDICQGEYVVFVDCDDRVSEDYISTLLEATQNKTDVISFQAEVSINGAKPKICYYSIDNKRDRNTADAYYRIPNHICCVKREIALKVPFPHIKHGEDAAYSKLLLPYLNSSYNINRILYYYDYNDRTTVAQEDMPAVKARRGKGNPVADVIILSNAKSPIFKALTEKAIKTCLQGANGLPVRIIVMEQQKVSYRNAEVVRCSEEFHYNKFANRGISMSGAPWVMVANNDLTFTNGWLHELIAAGHDVVSPVSPDDPRQKDIKEIETGYVNGRNLSGWCFMMKRDIWERISGLDEATTFWSSDDVVIEQLRAINVEPAIVPRSIVHHEGSRTLRSLPSHKQKELTRDQVKIFNKKYGQNKFGFGI